VRKFSAEFHTADGIRSVLHKHWPWPPPLVWMRGIISSRLPFALAEADVPSYLPDIRTREYRLETIVRGNRGPVKAIYREVYEQPHPPQKGGET
jgi:hypothetical protein